LDGWTEAGLGKGWVDTVGIREMKGLSTYYRHGSVWDNYSVRK